MAEDKDENKVPPVAVGDILKGQEVISSGKRNDGVVKYNGYIIFVGGAQKGDTVSFKVTKVMKHFGIGEKIEEL